MRKLLALSAFTAFCFSTYAMAGGVEKSNLEKNDYFQRGFYLGGGFGDGFRSDVGLAVNLDVGYQFNRYFSLEANYYSLEKQGYWASWAPPLTRWIPPLDHAVGVAAKIMYPVSKRFALFGKVGDAEQFATRRGTRSINNITAALGMDAHVSKRVSLTTQITRFFNSGDNLATVGVNFNFPM